MRASGVSYYIVVLVSFCDLTSSFSFIYRQRLFKAPHWLQNVSRQAVWLYFLSYAD